MKIEAATKLDNRKKTTSKNDDVMLENCDVIVIFLIHHQFRAIWKLESRCIVCKSYIFIHSNLLSYKH